LRCTLYHFAPAAPGGGSSGAGTARRRAARGGGRASHVPRAAQPTIMSPRTMQVAVITHAMPSTPSPSPVGHPEPERDANQREHAEDP
jgi:hypothetical protein